MEPIALDEALLVECEQLNAPASGYADDVEAALHACYGSHYVCRNRHSGLAETVRSRVEDQSLR